MDDLCTSKPIAKTAREKRTTSHLRLHLVHQLHRRPRRLGRQLVDRHLDGTQFHVHVDILVHRQAHILNHHSGQIGAVTVVFRVVDDSAAAAALLRASQRPARRALVRRDGDRSSRVHVHRLRLISLELGEGLSQIAGVHLLVGWVLVAHLPSVGRAGRRGDEEELVDLRGFKELLALGLLLAQNGGGLAKVDAWAHVAVQQAGAFEHLADGDRIFVGVEGADDAAEGGEWREGVQAGHDCDLVADGF